MKSLSTIKLDLNKKSYGYAKIYASLIKDEFQRKRTYASLVALYAFLDLIERTPFDVQKSMTLFRNPILNEKYELSDIYVNNWHLDVRIVVSGNAFLVPKIHIDNNLMPDYYVVVKVDKTLENAELVGIADTASMKTEAFDYHYNTVSFSNLISYDDFLLKVQREKKVEFTKDDHEFFKRFYLSITDGTAGRDTINRILKHVFECSECRKEFCCFTGFEMVSSNTGKYPELMNDETLNIVGAQKTDDEKYRGKEETVYIGKDEEAEIIEKNTDKTDETSNDLFVSDETGVQKYETYKQELKTQETELSDAPSGALYELQTENIDASRGEIEGEVRSEVQGETVSDILDELFDVKEDYLAHKEAEEKELKESGLQSLNSVSDDLDILDKPVDIFGDERYSELETIMDSKDAEDIDDNPLEINEDEELMEFSDDSGVSYIEPVEDDDIITDIEDTDEQEKTNENENLQKVIIDYDEAGEPVYSYITPIENPSDGSIDETAYIPAETEKNQIADNIIEDISINTEETASETAEQTKAEEWKTAEENNLNQQENEHESSSQTAVMNDSPLHNEADESETSLDEDNQKFETDETEEETIEEDSGDEEYEEAEYEEDGGEEYEEDGGEEYEEDGGEEYEEAEEYDDDDEEGTRNRFISKKAVILICSIFVLIGLIGSGIMLFIKSSNSKNNTDTAQEMTGGNLEIPQEQPQNNDMIEIQNNNEDARNNDIQNDNNENAQNTDAQNENSDNSTQAEEIEIPQLTENDIIAENNPPETDPNKAITNAFSNGGSAPVSINGISWNCTAALFTDKTFKDYLQHLDNLLKQNLKNNILNITETPQNRNVAVKLSINNDGNLEKAMISESSGSAQVDDVVLRSINEMFMGEKSPILDNNTLKQDRYYLKVVIKL